MSERQHFSFRMNQREWLLLVLPAAKTRWSLLRQPCHANHCLTSHCREGIVRSVTWSCYLHMFSGCFLEVFLNLPPRPLEPMGLTLPSHIRTKQLIQGRVGNALWCSSQFPVGKPSWNDIQSKTEGGWGQVWCVYGDEGNCRVMEMAATVDDRPSKYARVSGWI